jgi:type IV pilus biogenesis protein PilP
MNRNALAFAAIIMTASGSLAVAAQGNAKAAPVVPEVASSAGAAKPVGQSISDAGGTQSDEMGALDYDVQKWKKKAEIAKYKAEVEAAEARGGPTFTAPPSLPPGQGVMPPAVLRLPPTAGAMTTAKPKLVRIGGADGHFDALIDVDGHVVDAFVGDMVEGGWTVVSINASEVQLKHDRQTIVLKA